MVKVKVYNQAGKELKQIEVPSEIFAVKIKEPVIQQVVLAAMANKRQNLAHTKERDEIRGGGRKPWRQKGTGRARHGSIRSPLWRGGGITFGPRNDRNFKQKINDKVKKQALQMVLTNKLAAEHLIVVDKIDLKEAKTKQLASIINNLVKDKKSVVLALDKKNESIVKAAKNIAKLDTLPATSLNVLALLNKQYMIITESALSKVIKLYK